MEQFFDYMLITSALVAIIILIVVIVSPVLKKKYSYRWRYYVWLILALRLLLPIDLSNSESAIEVPSPSQLVDRVYEQQITKHSNVDVVLEKEDTNTNPNISLNENQEEHMNKQVSDRTESSWKNWIIAIWLCGVVLFLSYQLLSYYFSRKFIKRWSIPVIDSNINNMLLQVREELHVDARIPIAICTKVSSPMIMGLIHPVLLLPKELYTKADLNIIFTHELVHYKRYDIWYKFLLVLVTAMHWFNPFVYLMARRAKGDLEFICDDIVAGNMSRQERENYNEILFCTVQKKFQKKVLLSTNFNGGISAMKERFHNILNMNQKRKGYVILGLILLIVLASGFLISGGNKMANKNQQELRLPEKDGFLVEKMANSKMGILSVPELIYGTNQRVILYDYWGLIVYDLEQNKIVRAIDLQTIGMNYIQGDQYTQIQVNKEGTEILMHNLPIESADPKTIYLYHIESDTLSEVPESNFAGKVADNLHNIDSEEVVKEFGENNTTNGMIGRTLAKDNGQWIKLRMDEFLNSDGNLSYNNMKNLTINIIETNKDETNIKVVQVFHEYLKEKEVLSTNDLNDFATVEYELGEGELLGEYELDEKGLLGEYDGWFYYLIAWEEEDVKNQNFIEASDNYPIKYIGKIKRVKDGIIEIIDDLVFFDPIDHEKSMQNILMTEERIIYYGYEGYESIELKEPKYISIRYDGSDKRIADLKYNVANNICYDNGYLYYEGWVNDGEYPRPINRMGIDFSNPTLMTKIEGQLIIVKDNYAYYLHNNNTDKPAIYREKLDWSYQSELYDKLGFYSSYVAEDDMGILRRMGYDVEKTTLTMKENKVWSCLVTYKSLEDEKEDITVPFLIYEKGYENENK